LLKQFISANVQCPPPAFTQAQSLFFQEPQRDFVDQIPWQLVTYQQQNYLELFDGRLLMLKCTVQA